MKRYNATNTCDRCGNRLVPGKSYREYDKNENWTKKWLCFSCWCVDYNKRFDSYNNIIKSLRDHRTNNLDPNCASAKGDLFEELTCIWKGVKILGKENDNYCGPLDHSVDSEGKLPQTRGRFYNPIYGYWPFNGLEREWYKEFDYMTCYCASQDGKIIEMIYEFPKRELIKRTGISIMKNSSRGTWYEKYRVTDEMTIEKINEIWKKIINKDATKKLSRRK